ncbi:MFS transporter [Pantoea sp. Ap-967]|uniref:MFS transporter n=1 Tax=Pantoea sp. Ap-967 TaxID=2608362 RepID=UPI00141E7B01|nr:MFS transporter [Pantoea sp. Ap-967]NIE73318.1 MFS transporter [Pantoea sp. Ap-967]
MDPKSSRIRKIQTIALVLLFVIGIINYLDRSALSIANHAISTELGVTPTQMGILLSAFSWSYALAQLPMGALLDRFGVRRTMSLGLALWSGAQLLCGFISSYVHFIWLRVVLGAGESCHFPGGAKVISEWFNIKNRGFGTSVFTSAAMFAPAIAPIILTLILLNFGWRAIFISTGIAGLVLAVVFYALYRDRKDVTLTAEECLELGGEAQSADQGQLTASEWKSLLKLPTTWGLILGFVGVIYMLWLYLNWLPSYFEQERGLSLAHTGWVVAIPFLCGALGLLAVGKISDYLTNRGMTPVASRKYPICLGLLASALCTVPAAFTDSNTHAVIFISSAMFFLNIANGGAWSLVSIVIPSRLTASLGSLMNFGGYLGGSIAPIATGVIVERTGSFTMAFIVAAIVAIVGCLMFLFLIKAPERSLSSASSSASLSNSTQ